MLDLILTKLTEYWFLSGGAAFLSGGVFYMIDKFSCSERDFLNDCILMKNENLSKRSLLLKDFIEKIKNNFDNAQETQSDTYLSFFTHLSRHSKHDIGIDNMRGRFKLLRNLLLVLIMAVFFSLFIGSIFLETRMYISVFNIFAMILALTLLFSIRNLASKLDNLRNDPDLLS